MPEEHEKKEERDDANAGTLLKTVIDRLDSLHKRMDAMEEKEPEEKKEEPEPVAADKRKRKDSEEEEEEKKADARKKKDDDDDDDDSTVFYRGNKAPTRKKTDSRRRDDDDDDDARKKDDDDDDDARHKKDARRRGDDDDDSKKKDDSRRKRDDDDDDARRMKRSDDDDDDDRRDDDDDDDDDKKRKDDDDDDDGRKKADSASISRRIARVERMLPKQLSDTDRAAYSDVQARADDIYHAFGSQAPSPMQGETLLAYRQRIVTKLKEHSPTWKKTNVYAVADDAAFTTIESSVYADALTVAHSPATAEPGTLRMVTTMSGGHEIHEWVGEPRAWMDSMAGPVRMHVTSINTSNNRSA